LSKFQINNMTCFRRSCALHKFLFCLKYSPSIKHLMLSTAEQVLNRVRLISLYTWNIKTEFWRISCNKRYHYKRNFWYLQHLHRRNQVSKFTPLESCISIRNNSFPGSNQILKVYFPLPVFCKIPLWDWDDVASTKTVVTKE
jgi:hypothetical protein